MLLKLTFTEEMKMVNQFTGYIEIKLMKDPDLIYSSQVERNMINKRVNKVRKGHLTGYDFYIDCKDADPQTIKKAVHLFSEYYKNNGGYLALKDSSYVESNEIIKNLNIALEFAGRKIVNINTSPSSIYPPQPKFVDEHQAEKQELRNINPKSSEFLKKVNCGLGS